MSWTDARKYVAGVVAPFPKDLSGRIASYPDFESDGDCRFFFPNHGLSWHRAVIRAYRRAIRQRGGRCAPVMMRPIDFGAFDQASVIRFAQAQFRVLDDPTT